MKYIGLTDERTVCECCGKNNLKKTVVLQNPEGEYKFYGATCAAKSLGYNGTTSKLKTTMAKLHINERVTVRKEILSFMINTEEYQILKRWKFQLQNNSNINKEKAAQMIQKWRNEVIKRITEKFSYQINALHISLNEFV